MTEKSVTNFPDFQRGVGTFVYLRTGESDTHPDHGVRFVRHVIVLGDLYQVALHQDLGRGLHTQLVHQL